MERTFAGIGSVLALIGVALGAFAAHGLRGRVPDGDLDIFETAVRYQIYHALGLFAVAWVASRWPGTLANAAGWWMLAGTLIFSGSLYLLVLSGQRWLGAVTPLGGIALLIAWTLLAWRIWRA